MQVSNDCIVILPEIAFFHCYINWNSVIIQATNDVTFGVNIRPNTKNNDDWLYCHKKIRLVSYANRPSVDRHKRLGTWRLVTEMSEHKWNIFIVTTRNTDTHIFT